MELPGYVLYRWDRVGKRGGGVVFYALNTIMVRVLDHSCEVYCGKPEYQIAELTVCGAARLLLDNLQTPALRIHSGIRECIFTLANEIQALNNIRRLQYKHGSKSS